jgi:hypothetical protein
LKLEKFMNDFEEPEDFEQDDYNAWEDEQVFQDDEWLGEEIDDPYWDDRLDFDEWGATMDWVIFGVVVALVFGVNYYTSQKAVRWTVYVSPNYPSKKALKEAVEKGDVVRIFQPGPFATPQIEVQGDFSVEGPHYPKPHRWYARVRAEGGKVVKVLSWCSVVQGASVVAP